MYLVVQKGPVTNLRTAVLDEVLDLIDVRLMATKLKPNPVVIK